MAEAAYVDDLAFDIAPRDATAIEAETLLINVDGFEGPLDLLLTLARTQKVDLARISVLKLAEQYLEFVEQARALRIELAADYLVMAAWLAFLKSRLLLPRPAADDEPSGEELAAALAFRLERLAAMRRAAAELMGRDQLGRDFFARGQPETLAVERHTAWSVTLADLLKAYARVTTRGEYRPVAFDQREVYAVDAALQRLRAIIGMNTDWAKLAAFLPDGWRGEAERRRSAVASTFSAMLEMAKLGEIEIRQAAVFAPIFLRRRASPPEGETPG
jgi:segregation and condensation protein A